MFRPLKIACILAVSIIVLAACRREPAAPPAAVAPPLPQPATQASPAAVDPEPPVPSRLEDVIERTPDYVIGISYPRLAGAYPGLAVALRAYAESARAQLRQAVHELKGRRASAPYELSLSFTEQVATAQWLAIAADGSLYTGGAHGRPLIARFVWWIPQARMLTAQALLPEAADWAAVSSHVRERLHTQLSERIGAEQVQDPAARAESLRVASRMIDEGTRPDPRNFAQFEPVPGPDGRLLALRFVFPPYQVGPYADGVQSVEVPARVLLPKVAAEYRSLFVDR